MDRYDVGDVGGVDEDGQQQLPLLEARLVERAERAVDRVHLLRHLEVLRHVLRRTDANATRRAASLRRLGAPTGGDASHAAIAQAAAHEARPNGGGGGGPAAAVGHSGRTVQRIALVMSLRVLPLRKPVRSVPAQTCAGRAQAWRR